MNKIHNWRKLMSKGKNGLTLIEVLLAICILALVAAPIMQIIYTSLNLNLKSREILAATHCGQSVMEYITSMPFEGPAGNKGGFYLSFVDNPTQKLNRLPVPNNKKNGSNTAFKLTKSYVQTSIQGMRNSTIKDQINKDIVCYSFPSNTSDGVFSEGSFKVAFDTNCDRKSGFVILNYPYEDYVFDICVEFDPENELNADKTDLVGYYIMGVKVDIYSTKSLAETKKRIQDSDLLSSAEGSMFNKK